LPASTVESLTAQLAAHETKTGNQVAVLILSSLDGELLEEYSHRVATTWKLGQKGTDNGALLLVALKERKVRIEVGYGLEGALTDARSAQIIRNDIVPRFRAGDLPGGIVAGASSVPAPALPAAVPSSGRGAATCWSLRASRDSPPPAAGAGAAASAPSLSFSSSATFASSTLTWSFNPSTSESAAKVVQEQVANSRAAVTNAIVR